MERGYSERDYWVIGNLYLLAKRYGKEGVVLDAKEVRSLMIFYFNLPETWQPRTSRLLIVLPSGPSLFHSAPDRFYLDKGLKTITGKEPAHYFEGNGFNDMSRQGLARFSFHITKNWFPKVAIDDGTTLIDVIDRLYQGMDIAAKEVM